MAKKNEVVLQKDGFKKLYDLLNKEKFVPSGDTQTVELIAPKFVLNPKEPILNFPSKQTNIEYVEKELKWYLSQSLSIKDYVDDIKIWNDVCSKDDDKSINSNYGWCIFSEENGKQYENCLKKLAEDPTTRQALMIYQRPSMHIDWNRNGMHDFICFTENTIIKSPEGDITIKEIVEKIENGEKYPVFSVNFNTNEREIKWVTKGFRNGKRKILRVHLDNGEYFDTTENHIFYVKKQEGGRENTKIIWNNEIKAKDLKPNDSLVTAMIYKNGNGLCYKKSLNGNFDYNQRKLIHRDYYEFVTGETLSSNDVIHHIDENPYNNSFNNLQKMSFTEHRSLHMIGGKNPSNNRTEDQKNNQINKMVNTLKNTINNRTLEWYEKNNNLTFDKCIEYGKTYLQKYGKITQRGFFKWLKENSINYGVKTVLSHGLIGRKNGPWFDKFKEILNENHKVKYIEYLNEEQEVYDIEIEDNHNFFIGNDGILVHNCTDGVQVFIRDKKLIYIVKQRSCDAIFGFFNDFFWHCWVYEKFLKDMKKQKYNREARKVKYGSIIYVPFSFHVYSRHFDLLKKLATEEIV